MAKQIVIWCGEAPNQKALANKISKLFPVAGIVIDKNIGGRKKRKWAELPALIFDRLRFKKIYNSWKSLMSYYEMRFPDWPPVPLFKVGTINSPDIISLTEKLNPDLIVVSGTSLIKEPLLVTKTTIGIINLHTGLSPYVKGGPNCTNWCIANNEWGLIGNTIMWLNKGIDSGNIITTETIDIRNASSLNEAHLQVMEHAHDLYLRSIEYLSNTNQPFQSVSQNSIAKGTLYLNRMWTAAKRKQLLYNWAAREKASISAIPVTVPLPKMIDNEK